MWPLLATVGVCCFPWYEHVFGMDLTAQGERWLVHGLTIFVTLAHWHYGYGVVSTNNFVYIKLKCSFRYLIAGLGNV